MRAHCYFRPGLAHHKFWVTAFADGLRRHGYGVELSREGINPSDLLVVWGVRHAGAFAQQRGHGEICVLERGYIGDREKWTSVSFGGRLNGRAEFRGVQDEGSRFERYHPERLKPWQHRGGYALIMGQVPNDQSLVGVNIARWYADVAKQLRRKGYGDVRFRPHPLAANVRVPGVTALKGSLADAFAGAAFVVTWNSNSAVDAVLDGIPAVAVDEGSMAWEVSGHEIGRPPTPEHYRWAARLAWKQWSEDEIRSGECWEQMKHGREPARQTDHVAASG